MLLGCPGRISFNVNCRLVYVQNWLELQTELALMEGSVFVGLAYRGKDIVFGFIIEYSSLRDFGPLGNYYRSIFYTRIFER
jgi:hypothetical protein